jgi:hypothetical protein
VPTGEIYKNLRGQKLAEQAVACSEMFRQHAMHHISTPSDGIDVSVEGRGRRGNIAFEHKFKEMAFLKSYKVLFLNLQRELEVHICRDGKTPGALCT